MKPAIIPRPADNSLLRSRFGPLTRELVLQPADFGLGHLPDRLRPDAVTESVCGFCSTGCSLRLHLRDGAAVGLTPDPLYPVNLGMACPKGWESLAVLDAPDRATRPLLRDASGRLRPVTWGAATAAFADRFRTIQRQHGPDSLAWLGTGQIVTEELALLGAVAKFGMGIRHGDGNTRQCMATAVTAHKESFGFDAPPYTYADFEASDIIVLVGSNLCIAHPILWQRILRNRRQPEIVVIDPRRTETAMAATRHLPLRPKSDLVFFYGLARLLLDRGVVDRAYVERHTRGFTEFAAFLADFPLERTVRETGLGAAELNGLADLLADRSKRVSFWWTMGVNQSYEGVRVAQAIINLALMTGNLGRPGTGANSITGQCNAMGSRLFSNTTNLLGGREFTHPDDRAEVARILALPETLIPADNSWPYDRIIEAVDAGIIKGLWIVATNTAHSWIHQRHLRSVLGKLEFLVVQDMYHTTETAACADLVLPAAGWGEKEGTFINSERRIGRTRKVRRAPGEALADFAILHLLGEAWGCGEHFRRWSSPEAVFQLLKKLSAGRPCDFSGIRDYRHLEDALGIQWPYPKFNASSEERERRLFSDGRFFHQDGRARFIFELPRPAPEAPDREYPFILLTGRGTSAQWHTQSRTAKSAVLRKLYPEKIYIEVHPDDTRDLGMAAGDAVEVRSRRGALVATLHPTTTVQPGQVFLPMHYAETNRLTHPSFDPYSRQPAYKSC
ncbi:MAG: nitrate reductase, partial [Puniceicoccaceae bacterium]